MKGGSYASDAVVGAVDVAAFGKLTKNFTNAFEQKGGKRKNQKKGGADVPEKIEGGKRKNIKKKGGSLASANVLKSTTESSFTDLNAKFTNVVPTQKGAAPRKNRCHHCGKLLKGGNVTTPTLDSIMANASRVLSGNPTQTSETFAQGLAFKSEPAPVPPSSVIKLLDGLSPGPAPAASLKGGFGGQKLRNINDYKQNGSYKVFNRKQLGGHEGALKVGLNTNDSIMSSKNTVGTAPIRVPNETTLNIIANEEINGPMLMAKTSHFGDVTGLVESKTNFSFGGAKARKPPTAPRKTPVSKSSKKPKGKACA
jgi:hypothetical protein